MQDLKDYSNKELYLRVFNDGYLYKMATEQKTVDSLVNHLNTHFKFTKEQMQELLLGIEQYNLEKYNVTTMHIVL